MEHPDAHDLVADEQISVPSFNPIRLYDAEDGEVTLQSQMGLLDDIDTFVDTLDVIREVWREHDIDIQVPYKWQDPEVMHSIKQEVIKRLPYLSSDYEDAWPVTFYLKRALKNHGCVNSTPSRYTPDPDGAYRFYGQLPRPKGGRKAPARAAHHNDIPGFYRMRSLSPIHPEDLVPLRRHWLRRKRAARAETSSSRDSSPYPSSSSSSSSSSRSGSAGSSPSPPGSPPPRPQCPPSSTSSASSRTLPEQPEPHATCPPVFSFNRAFARDKSAPTTLGPFTPPPSPTPSPSPTAPSHTSAGAGAGAGAGSRPPAAASSGGPILDLLLSFAVPPADAQRLVQLLASLGITDVRYLRTLARMCMSDGWLRGLHASGRLSEIEVLVLREMMARAGAEN